MASFDQIPSQLKFFNLFIEGKGYGGKVKKLTPPKLKKKTQEFQGGPMFAPIDIDMCSMEKMTASIVLAEYNVEVLKRFGFTQGSRLPIRFGGSLQAGNDKPVPMDIAMTVMINEIDFGDWEAAKPTEMPVGLSVYRYACEIGGVKVLDLAPELMRWEIDGVDFLADHRAAINF